MGRLWSVVLCVAALAAVPVVAPAFPADHDQRLLFYRLPVNGALTQNTVTDIVQDRRGLMWFGTLGGLDVYDGYRFRTIPSDPREPDGLSGVHVSRLYEDREGNLWVGGFSGWLDRLEPASGRIHHYPRELYGDPRVPTAGQTAFFETASGALLIGTPTGLHRYDPATDAFVFETDEYGRVLHMVGAGGERVWLGTNTGVFLYDAATRSATKVVAKGLPAIGIVRLLFDSHGRLWLATGTQGLARLDPGAKRAVVFRADDKDPSALGSDTVVDMMEDSTGRIWVANQSGGLSRFVSDAAGFEVHRHDANDEATISSNDVWSLHEDRTGLIWIGTAGGGLNQINPSRRRFDTLRSVPFNENSLRSGFVWALAEDADGDVWMATLAGLERYSPAERRFALYEPQPGSVTANQLQSVAIDARGAIWAGAVDGRLYRVDRKNGSFRAVTRPDGPTGMFDTGRIWMLYPHGELLWVAGVTGLYALSVDTFEVVHVLKSGDPLPMGGTPIRSILPAPSGGYWLGSAGAGLARYVPGQGVVQHFVNERVAGSLSDNVVRALHLTDAGLWVGTQNGLNFIRRADLDAGRAEFTLFTVADGLPNNTVYGIVPDGHGRFWLTTNAGLSRFDPVAVTFENFTVADGLPSNELNGGAELRTRDGHLFFGGVAGVTIIHGDDLAQNDVVPEVLVTGIALGGRPVAEVGRDLRVPYGANDLAIEFAVTDYHQPEKNAFEYRLIGASDEWRAVDERRVSFNRLEPGRYRFEVRGSNNDGVWSADVAGVDFAVMPPPWRSGLAYALYAGLLLTGFIVYHRFQRRRLARQQAFNEELKRAHSLAEANHQLALHYAQFDQLTQLPNRAYLLEILGRHMRHAAVSGRRLGVLLINIDRFQRINDSFGHAVGDRVLKSIAERLAVLATDTLARIGSDEFVWFAELEPEDEPQRWIAHHAEIVNRAVGRPFDFQDPPIVMSASVGCSIYDGGPESASDVLGFADIALHQAKEQPDRGARCYDPAMAQSVRHHLALEARIKRALDAGEFSAHFQPLVDVGDRQLRGCEALIRWFPPGGEPVFPDQFIPVAEKSELIVDLGNWMIRHVCEQIAAWGEFEPRDLQVAINVSMRQLRSGTLVPALRAAMADYGVPPQALKIEITESAMMENVEDTAEQLAEVRRLGVDISVDDFGTGFSSLSHLKLLPVTELKIDRSFVMDLESSADSRTIVTSIVRLAHEMDLRVVAEGVEDERALAWLEVAGCDLAQGYLFARPLTAQALVADGWIGLKRSRATGA